MPYTENVTTKVIYPYATSFGHTCGDPNYWGPQARQYRKTSSWSNDKISRPRPPEPLWLNQTALPMQWTKMVKAQFERKIDGPYPHVKRVGGFLVYCDYSYITEYLHSTNIAPPGSPEPTNWELEARSRIKDELCNLGETLFEYRETGRMFSTLAETMYDGWQWYRKRKIPKRLQKRITPASIPASYLAAEFGIKPLMNDCFAAYDVFKHRVQLPIYRRVYAKGKSISSSASGTWTRSDRATIYCQLEPERETITLGNPFELSWNLIPFSLVVDWVIPIGETLSAMDALRSVTWMTGSLSRKESFEGEFAVPVNSPGFEVVEPYHITYKSHRRDTLSSIPFAQPPLRWEPSKSWGHITKGLSLLYLLRGFGKGGVR